jgi:hypothetical protein
MMFSDRTAIVVLAGLLGAGCVTPPEGIKTVDGVEQDDIPVPRDFEFQSGHTPASASEASFRSWHGYYKGTGNAGDIAPWYVTEMRKHGWEFQGMDGNQDVKRLHFVKGQEVARIEIAKELDPKEAAFVPIVHAEIHPRGTEQMTFEEELTFLRGGDPEATGAPRPASFAADGEPAHAISPGTAPASAPPVPAAGKPARKAPPASPSLDPADELDDLRQVEALEKSAQ